VPDDTNGFYDVFVHDRQTGTTERVSVSSEGEEGDEESGFFGNPISRDGRIVAFRSFATNLVPNDTNGQKDIFVHDRETGETTRVSVSSSGRQGNSGSHLPDLSPDERGRYVLFFSVATNLVNDDRNFEPDGFVHDRDLGITYRVTARDDGVEGNGIGGRPTISADGRYVAFASSASNLVEGDTNGWRDVFLKDLQTGNIALISTGNNGERGNANSDTPFMTPDGRFISFESEASNFADQDVNPTWDLFLRDRLGALCRGLVPTYVGTRNDDFLQASGNRDIIHGLSGNDRILGVAGEDVLCGGAGNDELRGSLQQNFRTILDGGEGDDMLRSGQAADVLLGGPGVDICDGGAGNDQSSACETVINIP
jgi:hypothetical protein